jgi:hypothetical protein
MSDDQTDQTGTDPSGIGQTAPTPGPPGEHGSGGEYSWAPPRSAAAPNGRGQAHRLFASAITAWIVAALLALAVVGLSVALAVGNSSPTAVRPPVVRPAPASPLPTPAGPGSPFGGRLNLGVAGTVTSVGSGTFSVKGVGGQTVTVDEQSSTIYQQGATTTTAAAVTTGSRVLVLGTRSGAAVKATRVVILPAGVGGFGQIGGSGQAGGGAFAPSS